MAKFQFIEWLEYWLGVFDTFEFDWDRGNESKAQDKHNVTREECEQVFYDSGLVALGIQTQPVVNEPRFGVVGKTEKNRLLHIAFTIRDGKIRVISGRPAHKKERALYE